ncbi:Membrane alanyl aminopeptidase [Eumeta japonica]|uniref:Aminopeptidase n=1 Tax=Eumeta variegata TaxID=151549 RepID=A0A4C1W4H9_EUMVA|nr:Membrane alanyl aminopeptidase [Eumeta japonica]
MPPHSATIILVLGFIASGSSEGDTNYRLNSLVTPTAYTIVVTPYFDTGDVLAFTFDGEVSIKLQTQFENVTRIKLHSKDLNFTENSITIRSGQVSVLLDSTNPLEFDDKYSFAYINLNAPLQVSTEYILNISYRGPIRDDLQGFYRSSYVERGITKWVGATQMEPTHARKVFPCFDEPQYKATFGLMIDRPLNYSQSLANTKLQTSLTMSNGYVREVFYPSPKMPTYLVAFLISEFQSTQYSVEGSKEFGIYTRPEATNQTDYAFDFGKRVVDAMSAYLNIDYYSTDANLKLDHVGLPDFRGGAMENWGLIKYREGLLLYVPEESSPYYKYRVAQIMAHETTHMWFGNLVTCHWWSNTWLNEGFANYFENYITEQVEPELRSGDISVISSVYAAYVADEVPEAAAITNENVNSPEEISAHFGTISYQKAGSVIRMIHHLIGDEAFKYGLNIYLNSNKFGVGTPDSMYDSLQIGANAASSLNDYNGYTVGDVMSSWIAQPGHPVLNVDIDYDTEQITLTQKRFYSNSSIQTGELYTIPISYTTANAPDFENTKPAFIMDDETYTFNATNISASRSWVIFNIQETGFYRVNYNNNAWKIIGETLRNNEARATINNLNRAKIVNDLFAFLEADLVSFSTLNDVLEFLADETDYSVWYAAISGFNTLRKKLMATDALEDFDNYVLRLMQNIIDVLGYDVKEQDDFVTLRNRMQILEYACKLGHSGCIENSVGLFSKFKENGTVVTPSLRLAVYCSGLRHGDADDYEFVWDRMLTTNVVNEIYIIQSALGCTKVQDKLLSYLASVMVEDSPIRSQDFTVPFTSILADHSNVEIALEFFQEYYDSLNKIFPNMDTVVTYFPAAMHLEDDFEKVKSRHEFVDGRVVFGVDGHSGRGKGN